MNPRKKIILSFFCALLCCKSVLSQNDFNTEIDQLDIDRAVHYNSDSGLPSDKVYNIIQGNGGYIWFGTESGISKFNGQSFTNYSTKDKLRKNDIVGMMKTTDGKIWLTSHGATGYFHNNEVKYIEFSNNKKNKFSLNYKVVTLNNRAWISDHRSLHHIDLNTNAAIESKYLRKDLDYAHRVVGTYNNKLVVVYRSNIYLISPESSLDFNLKARVPAYKIMDHQVPLHSIEIISYNDGILCYLKYNKLVLVNLKTNHKTVLSQNIPDAIGIIKLDNKIYIPKVKNGLYELELDNNDNIISQRLLLPGKNITDIYRDKNKNLWVSTYDEGIFFFPKINTAMSSLKIPSINTIFVKEDQIWMGDQKANLYRYDKKGLKQFPLPNKNPFGVTRIMDIVDAKDKGIAISSDAGLHVMYEEQLFFLIQSAGKKLSSYQDNIIFNTHQSCVSLPIDCIDTLSNSPVFYDDNRFMSLQCIEKILKDRSYVSVVDPLDNLYVSNIEQGLLRVDKNRNKNFIQFSKNNSEEINDLEVFRNHLLIGTNGVGLSIVELNNLDQYSFLDGISSSVITSLSSNEEHVFVGTNKGLNILTPYQNSGQYSIRLMTKKNGLLSNDINDVYATADKLYIVTDAGLNILELNELEPPETRHRPLLEDVFIDQLRVDLESKYTLQPNQNDIRFKYNKIDFLRSGTSLYAYKMKGYEENFNYTSSTETQYPNLPPGDYIFQLGLTDGLSFKPTNIIEIPIEVKPSFIQTIWARILGLLVTIGIIWLIFNTYYSKRDLKFLSQKVEERTQELKDKVDEINNINRQLEASNYELSRSNEELERFAYIASHDLKQPLNNIIAFSQLLEKEIEDDDIKKKTFANFISKGAIRMNNLIKDVLEYSSINKTKSQEESIDLNALIKDIEESILSQLQERNASIVLKKELPHYIGVRTNLFLVFKNLIENGIKYNQSKAPRVTIEHHVKEGFHFISFKDNGIGIDEKYFPKLFIMFSRLENDKDYEGTGLGLSLCKKILENLGGHISVASKVGKGSTFTVALPFHEDQ